MGSDYVLTGNPIGRPPKYKTVEAMAVKMDAYFDKCAKEGLPLTVTGLCLALDFCERKALIQYVEKYPDFRHTIKKAKLRIEHYLENRLALGKGNAAGLIFNLKNNFKWVDRHEIDQKIEGKLSLAEVLRGADKQIKGIDD